MQKHRYIAFIIFITFFILSCASPRVAVKKDFDFSKIKTVRIGEFTSSTSNTNSGSVVANEFVRQLLDRGYSVKTSDTDASDVVIMGSVTEYFPNRRYLLINQENEDSQQTVVLQQQIEISGTSAYNLGSVFGMGDESKIVVSNATVGILAYLKDVNTGDVVWSSSYTYEGIDLQTALEGTVRYLLNSWKK